VRSRNRAAVAWTMCYPRPPRAIGAWSRYLPRRPSFSTVSHSQHEPGGIVTAQMTCDDSQIFVRGFPSLNMDHRIMLDVEFVLGLALLS
jgi:hypothetical protein